MDCHDTRLLFGSRLVHSLLDIYCSFLIFESVKSKKQTKNDYYRSKTRSKHTKIAVYLFCPNK